MTSGATGQVAGAQARFTLQSLPPEPTWPAPVSFLRRAASLTVRTAAPLELVDLTDLLCPLVADSGLDDGFLHLFCAHTTAGLMINENETGFREDFANVLDELASCERYWAHDDLTRRRENLVENERPNGHSHVRASLVTHSSLTVPVVNRALTLGRWQRLFLVELDGGRDRQVLINLWGAAGSDGPNGRLPMP